MIEIKFRSLIVRCFNELGYPTIRELREYLRLKDPRHIGMNNWEVEGKLMELKLEGLKKFETTEYHAKYRFHLWNRVPIRKKPLIFCIDKKDRKKIEYLASRRRNASYGDYVILKDESRRVRYIIKECDDSFCIDGVYCRNRFRFPTIRYRNFKPYSEFRDGWSEMIYASQLFHQSTDKFLKIRAC